MRTLLSVVAVLLASPPATILAFSPVPVSSSGNLVVPQQQQSPPWNLPTTTRSTPPPPPLLAAALVNIDDDESMRRNRDVASMEAWARKCGVQSIPGFRLVPTDNVKDDDWHVMTTDPIQEGNPILVVPEPMIMSAAKTRQELQQLGGSTYNSVQEALELLGRLLKMNDNDDEQKNDVHNQFYLFLKILLEYQRGDASPWFPWLNSLPRSYYNGPAMTPFCFECLPPLVSLMAKEERAKFIFFCQALKRVDFVSEEAVKNSNDNVVARWAYNAAYTRSVKVNGDERIVPMADMFNHGAETEIQMKYDGQGNCLVVATKNVPAGSPLRTSYGDPTNPSYLFARYGFLDESSPATFCKIMSIRPSTELIHLGLGFSRMLFYKDTGDISREVWDVVLYDILDSDKDLQEVKEAFYRAHMRGDVKTKQAIHQQFFLETAGAIKNHVDLFLEQLDELSAKAMSIDPVEHPRIPLILEHNDFVRRTFRKVKERIDPAVAQALAAR